MSFRSPVARRPLAAGALALVFAATALGACSSGSDGATTTTVRSATTAPTSTTTTDSGDTSTSTTAGRATTTSTADRTTTTVDRIETTTSAVGPVDDDRAGFVAVGARYLASDGITEPEDSECTAGKIVDAIGLDRLHAAGLKPEDFDDDLFDDLHLDRTTAAAVYDAFGGCDVDLREMLLSSMSGEPELACLKTAISEDLIRDGFIEIFQGNEPDALNRAYESCIGDG